MKSVAIAIVLASTAVRADSDLSMPDLFALDKQQHWTELLDSADRVKPAGRTADWTRLVTAAATRVVQQVDRASTSGLREASALVDVVPRAERKYTFLVGDAAYLGAKAMALQSLVAACGHQTDYGCGALAASLADGVTRFPPGTAKAIAILVGADQSPAEATHFWALAVDDDKDACKESALARSIVGALRVSSVPRQIADAQRAASACYAVIEDALVDELVKTADDAKHRPLYLDNACPVLKTHGTMTIAKRKKCP